MITEQIKNRRLFLGLTAKKLCELSGVKPGTYSPFEKGDKNISYRSFLAIVDQLGLFYHQGELHDSSPPIHTNKLIPAEETEYTIPLIKVDISAIILNTPQDIIIRQYNPCQRVVTGIEYKCIENDCMYKLMRYDPYNHVFFFDAITEGFPTSGGTLEFDFQGKGQSVHQSLVKTMKQ